MTELSTPSRVAFFDSLLQGREMRCAGLRVVASLAGASLKLKSGFCFLDPGKQLALVGALRSTPSLRSHHQSSGDPEVTVKLAGLSLATPPLLLAASANLRASAVTSWSRPIVPKSTSRASLRVLPARRSAGNEYRAHPLQTPGESYMSREDIVR